MSGLSDEQRNVVHAPLNALSVIACAGSGKTKTAVHRLEKIKYALTNTRSHVALLSFSNIAVDTFKKTYLEISSNSQGPRGLNRVTIDTVDGFITSHIIRPHAHRTMGCSKIPFLVDGSEPFLLNKELKFWYELPSGEKRPVEGSEINNVTVDFDGRGFNFKYKYHNSVYIINNGLLVTKRLGCIGAYTHELGKFWALKSLCEQENILSLIVNRYPHIIVDEAQDISLFHQYILELFAEKGTNLSLVGDPCQAIYEFSGATGQFIVDHDSSVNVHSLPLTTNYRSIPEILSVANSISKRNDVAFRNRISEGHGAYYVAYETNDHQKLISIFEKKLQSLNLSVENSAVLYRGNADIQRLNDFSKNLGIGKIKLFSSAALYRDVHLDYFTAFQLVSRAVIGLLKDVPDNILSSILKSDSNIVAKSMREDLWCFTRSTETGLPSAHLKASTEWHACLKNNLFLLLANLEEKYKYTKINNFSGNIKKTKLIDYPLAPDMAFNLESSTSIRVTTVHKVKGESLDGVLYIAKKDQIHALLDGVSTELGRIGYVAVTRAKDLFVLAVPKIIIKELSPRLDSIGFKKWNE
ncbi:DEAD/DEAH box helicase [Cellvibrio sp. PSBB006]|uniref:DEAD/DEAH box helicase n=1 Tax=Cellvibrio sp. PSBB006 TaxID=1987723 RepID=UPI0012F9BEE5|nr:DEAD/DEAH box helicase [Cellvibrio sp. PSBB006]